MQIRVDSRDSLERVASYCHDAVFDTDMASYDKESMVFSLPMTREMWEKAEKVWRVLFVQRFKVPKIESVLTLYSVASADIHASDVEDILEDIKYDASRKTVVFRCMKGTQIYLKVDDLQGHLQDTGEQYFDGTRFTTLSPRP